MSISELTLSKDAFGKLWEIATLAHNFENIDERTRKIVTAKIETFKNEKLLDYLADPATRRQLKVRVTILEKYLSEHDFVPTYGVKAEENERSIRRAGYNLLYDLELNTVFQVFEKLDLAFLEININDKKFIATIKGCAFQLKILNLAYSFIVDANEHSLISMRDQAIINHKTPTDEAYLTSFKRLYDTDPEKHWLASYKKHYNTYCEYLKSPSFSPFAEIIASTIFPELLELDISLSCITDSAFQSLIKAFCSSAFPKLQILNLHCNHMSKECHLLLARAIRIGVCPQIKVLTLSNCKITDESFQPIIEAIGSKKLSNLEELDLTGTKLTDSSFDALAKAINSENCPRFKSLTLDYCKISDASLKVLAQIASALNFTIRSCLTS